MKSTNVKHGDILAAQQRLWVAIGDNADKVVARINANPGFVKEITQFMIGSDNESTVSPIVAREIMGKNFFGVEEAVGYFGLDLMIPHLTSFAKVPYSKDVLESCRLTHVLVATLPLSFLDTFGIVEKKLRGQVLFSRECSPRGYEDPEFVPYAGRAGWRLVRKTIIANSTSKETPAQLGLIPKNEMLPSSHVMVYTIIGHFLATGERLFEGEAVRCSDGDKHGNLFIIGPFSIHGLEIYSGGGSYGCNEHIGVTSVWKYKG